LATGRKREANPSSLELAVGFAPKGDYQRLITWQVYNLPQEQQPRCHLRDSEGESRGFMMRVMG
jgi:hypothetical protein